MLTSPARPAAALALGACALAAPAHAQISLSWWTVDGGGGTSAGAGGLSLSATVGQCDAGTLSGGGLTLSGGFWSAPGQTCYANCDGSTTAPLLNVADFSCFLQKFAAGDAYANCDGSAAQPVLNVADFSCFLQRFAAGCP